MVRDGDDVARGDLGRGVRPLRRAAARRSIAEHGIEAVTAYVGNPLAHNLSLSRYVGDPHRDVGHPDDLLGRHRRPVAEERQLAPHVRRHVEDPGARHPPHRPVRRHGRQPARVAGLAAGLPRRDGRDRRDPGARRQGDRDRPRAAPAPPSRPTSGCRSRPAPTPRCCWRSSRCCSPRAWSTSARSPTCIDGVDELARARGRAGRPSGSRGVTGIAGRAHPRARPRAARHRAGRRLRPHRALQPGVRHAGQLAGRRRQHAHRPLRRAGRRRCSPGRRSGRSPTCRCPGSRAASPNFGRWKTRVRGAPEVLGHVPVSCLAEEIATPGRGPDPGAVHGRRQPGAVDARAATGSTPPSPGSTA